MKTEQQAVFGRKAEWFRNVKTAFRNGGFGTSNQRSGTVVPERQNSVPERLATVRI